ncbi:MAG TPA: glycosyltransferase 87 family protein [Bdellovibrionota bacterium]|nr:glycosyltransferase 87 family protein [Bdellovibrionota bacterium]
MKHSQRMHKAMLVICAFAGVAAFVRLFLIALGQSHDFEVYWNAAVSLISGVSPYNSSQGLMSANPGFVFKYPPWVLPFFAPFAFLSWSAAKAVWALGEIVALLYAVVWTARKGSLSAALLGFGMFWWIWIGHFASGQVTLLILAAALFLGSSKKSLVLLGLIFSSKVFSLVTLLGFGRRVFNARVILGFIIAASLLTGIVVLAIPGHSVSALVREWILAAGSGGAELGAEVVRGPANHGFTAFFLRLFDADPRSSEYDLMAFMVLSALLGFLWNRFSGFLSFEERWSGWLALGVLVHPLAWHHSFVLVYPLCVLAIAKAVEANTPRYFVSALVGTAMIGLFIPELFGSSAVRPLELAGIKAWGTCLCAFSLVRAQQCFRMAT